LLAAILVLPLISPALAQSGNLADRFYQGEEELEEVFDSIDLSAFERGGQDEYAEASYIALTQLYWAINKLDLSNDTAIDNYLLINECELYTQFYHNDFEWSRLRDATRRSIEQNRHNFPTKFEVVMPILLGRYDIENREFALDEDTKIHSMRRLDFNHNSSFSAICSKRGDIDYYPKNIVIVFNRPFSFDKLPVPPEIAEMYLDETNREIHTLNARLQELRTERVAYLRLKVSITKYDETVKARSGHTRAVVFGHIDGIEVYADRELMKPMYLSQVSDNRMRRFRSRSATVPQMRTQTPVVEPVIEQKETLEDIYSEERYLELDQTRPN